MVTCFRPLVLAFSKGHAIVHERGRTRTIPNHPLLCRRKCLQHALHETNSTHTVHDMCAETGDSAERNGHISLWTVFQWSLSPTLARKLGREPCLYLALQRRIIQAMFFLCGLGLCVALPLNMSGSFATQELDAHFARTTIENVQNGLWCIPSFVRSPHFLSIAPPRLRELWSCWGVFQCVWSLKSVRLSPRRAQSAVGACLPAAADSSSFARHVHVCSQPAGGHESRVLTI